MLRIKVFSENRDALGEDLLWHVQEQRLYWIDSYGSAACSRDVNGKNRKRWPLPELIGSLALREKGGAIVAPRSGVGKLFRLDTDLSVHGIGTRGVPESRFPG